MSQSGETYLGNSNDPDDGTELLPATAFPASGAQIQVVRSNLVHPDNNSTFEGAEVVSVNVVVP